MDASSSNHADAAESIAIIGMAGRFPQAATLEEFWANLRAGREAVSFFEKSETQALPLERPPSVDDPHFVRARALLDRPEWFDAEFFRIQPREAAIMDPQQRVFLECAWEALEDAGCNPDTFDGAIGVFAGAGFNTYLFNNLLTNRNLIADYGLFPVLTMNEKDYLATRVAYKLNLRGPGINVQTACSTSLVATSLACQQLLAGLCDVALAGGVSIGFPANRGHHHAEGGIMSQDGHCRAFDAKATGTVAGSGAGVVVLKRLGDALADRDRIVAVIKGSAVNNDGGLKMGFTAPGIEGQAECIATAQAIAGCPPETISYVETHGTGTPLGDPIEIAALTKAFGLGTNGGSCCAIGSLKTNLGHLDVAAGVAGLIKTALALQHGEIPPSLHFETPNPAIDFARTPFFVNATLRPWRRGATPRRAGVSSFGIGGTNAHVVLEEAPPLPQASPARPHHLLVLSARTPAALEAATENLAAWLERGRDLDLADAAFTLQTGRKAFEHRRAVVAGHAAEAVAALRARDGARLIQGRAPGAADGVVFMFPGQGAQQVDMARELYATEPVFRRHVDDACDRVQPLLGLNLRDVLFPADDPQRAEAEVLLRETRLTQPALFIIEHALARLWMSWGVTPAAMIGHSLGEYVAACLAGVFTLGEALAVVVERAKLMQAQPAGAMLAIRLSESAVAPWLNEHLTLAAINAPALCVVSGSFEAIEALEQKLAAGGIAAKRLATSHAFHSATMEPAMAPLAKFLRHLVLRPPQLRWISNVTGTWITPQQATSADYWATQMRRTVRFADGLGEIVKAGRRILLEVGPGRTLAGLARQHPAVAASSATVAATLERHPDVAAMLHALGQLWVAGVQPDWSGGFHAQQKRRILALPTYPFQRKRCWIEPGGDWPSANATAAERVVPAAPRASERAESGALGTTRPTSAAAAAHRNGDHPETLAALIQIFHQLSGIDLSPAATEQTFHQLGFDSLFLAQVSTTIERRFGVAIAFRQLGDELSTLRKVAAHVDRHAAMRSAPVRAENAAKARSAPEVRARPSEPAAPTEATAKRVPLTEAQREIWVVSQLGAAASAAYTEAAVMQLAGPLDVPALRRAVRALVARHEALRTTFAAAGDLQIIAATSSIELSFHDCPAAEAAAACVAGEAERPFDLARGPLFRPVLARIEAEAHVLALIVHHIICDGWSLGILVRELASLYAAEAAGRPPVLPRAPLFSAYVEEEAKVPRAAPFAAAEAYWQKTFADAVPVIDLPTDRPRPASRSYAGDFVSCTLSPELSTAVKQFCAQRESTAFTGLLAVFGVLLHRLTGQDDLVVGVPTAGQALQGHPDLVGHFANLIPIRSRLRQGQSFTDHFAEMHRQVSEALVHGSYPFVRLLQLLKLPRDASRVPLTPVLFNTTHHRGTLAFADATATLLFHPKRQVNFDLNFNLALTGDALALGCYYSTELFDRSTVTRWFGHFQTLLHGVLANPHAPLADVSLLTEAERHTITIDWNNTALAYRHDASIPDLFEEQVRRTPDAIAILDRGQRITYADLDQRAERLAAELRGAGVRPDVLVGIFLDRSAHLLVAILAVLKAGGAYVPLDPTHPSQRRAFVITDSRMLLVISQPSLVDALQAPSLTRLVLVGGEEPRTGETRIDGAPEALRPSADNLAYVLYTSGSTGEPKGVCVPHRGVVALVAWARQQYRPPELAGVLFATSATFDVSVFESLVPLCLGGRIILAPNLLQLPDVPGANEVTLVSGVPSAMAEIVRAGRIPASVRTVNLAGEPCPQSLVEALYALPHIERVYDLYGPTETTVYSSGSLRCRAGRPTIGRPLPNEQIYILDTHQHPVPIGVRGELYIGGDKLARGYLRRPALTGHSFVTLPALPARRVYRTGDAARFRSDGTIEYLGRLDHQVKLRGYRLELGEIESKLREHPAVAEAVATVRAERDGAPQVLAYFVPTADATVTGDELRDHLARWLPAPMVPVAMTRLERMPRTSSGKVDRAALPEPDFGTLHPTRTPPRTETERFLSELWCEVIGVEQIGVHDNFFALGGHSLHAMQLILRLQAAFGVELSFEQFFASPTIAALAPAIEQAVLQDAADQSPVEAEAAPGGKS